MKPSAIILLVSIITITMTMTSVSSQAIDIDSHRQQVETLFQLTQMEKKIQDSVDSVVQLQLRQNPQLSQHKQTVNNFFQKKKFENKNNSY